MTEQEFFDKWLPRDMTLGLRGLANDTDRRVGTMTAGQYAIGLEGMLVKRLAEQLQDAEKVVQAKLAQAKVEQPKVEMPKVEPPKPATKPLIDTTKPALKPLNGVAIPQGAKR